MPEKFLGSNLFSGSSRDQEVLRLTIEHCDCDRSPFHLSSRSTLVCAAHRKIHCAADGNIADLLDQKQRTILQASDLTNLRAFKSTRLRADEQMDKSMIGRTFLRS